MKQAFLAAMFALAMLQLFAQQQPWQQITVPTIKEVAANFRTPPREYGAIHWAIWGGELTRDRIVHEFDMLTRNGIFVVNIGPARGINPKYLSQAYFNLIKFAVEEASRRGMKIWLADEGSYPSGFAGGEISAKYPQLCMQGIVPDVHISVAPGQTLSMTVPPDTLGALTVNSAEAIGNPLPIIDGRVKWTAPSTGRWEIVLIRHVFRSSPTRYINRADGSYSKDSLYSLIDYLNPDATRVFLKTTHEVYKQLFGSKFGKTVLGFFGDEPDYTGFMPWTPTLLEQFKRDKGYDLQPYLPLLFAPKLTPEAWRIKADYWDVWSSLFRDNFFKVQADWCASNNLEYLVHLNHEELMLNLSHNEDLIRNEGDFFRDMRYVQVPGVDNLSQLIPEVVNRKDNDYAINDNFPKLASSAAHLFGHPKAWSEEGGGLGKDGKFQVDYQLVRGITALQLQGAFRQHGFGSPGEEPDQEPPPGFAMLAWYTNCAGYLMSVGRPAAQVALYLPTNSMWLGDEDADRSATKLGKQLLEHQIDFDYIDEQSLSSLDSLEHGGFRNLSGQVYRAVIFPSSVVISRSSLNRLRKFAATGGKVIFIGHAPTMVVDRTFLHMTESPDLSFALIEPSGDLTASVIADLPRPDVKLDRACPWIKYTHRAWRDADLYFFFNESDQRQSRRVFMVGNGRGQVWDLGTGLIHPVQNAVAKRDGLELPLVFEPYEAKVIVIGPLPPPETSAPEPDLSTSATVQEITGEWTLTSGKQTLTAPLKSWQDLGIGSNKAVVYTKEFNLVSKPAGQRLLLECGDVRDYARVRLNGMDLKARAWQPYRWDVTSAVKTGRNVLQIEVIAYPTGRMPAPISANPAPVRSQDTASLAVYRRRLMVPPVSGLLGPVRLVTCK